MAVEPAIMQVISKSTDYSKEKVNLELFETSIKDIIRKIKGQAGDTLNAVSTGDYISDSLLADIKDKQNYYLSNFDDYITEIEDYADTDPRSDLSPYQVYSYIYSAINTGIIEAEDEILNIILNEIMNNEGFFYERRVSIRNILWYIRNIINNTGIFGQFEANQSKIVAFLLIAYDDLILDDIIDVMEGGEEALQLKQYTLSVAGGATASQALASDEILYSIDSFDQTGGSSGVGVSIGVENNGITKVIKSILYLGETAMIPILDSTSSTLPTFGLNSTVQLNSVGDIAGTLKFTVRKISVYI